MPEGVTEIGAGAFGAELFGETPRLERVALPESVTKIGWSAFDGCTFLSSINIPKGVKIIEACTFRGCAINSIIIPDGVTEIGGEAFRYCPLTSINIPDSVTKIGSQAFDDTLWIERYPNDFVVHGEKLLRYKGKDIDVVLPNGIKEISDGAFCECESLTSVTIPEGVSVIGDEAFSYCSSLTSVTIPESVTEIGIYAFNQCESLTSVTIPESVTEIGIYAFNRCESLTSITIPESVTKIGIGAFDETPWLDNYPDDFVVVGRNILIKYKGKNTDIVVPKGVSVIGKNAFSYNRTLKSVTLPEGITKIESETFYFCSSLKSINLPEGVTEIEERAFRDCNSLVDISIPKTVTKIDNHAFSYCRSLKSVTVPGSINGIGEVGLEEITFNPNKVEIADIVTMLKTKDYTIKLDYSTKCRLLANIFLQTAQPEAEAYIKKNALKIFRNFINENDYSTIKALLDSGKFVTKKNIDKIVEYAITNTQKGGDMQIQALIANYKNEHFGASDFSYDL